MRNIVSSFCVLLLALWVLPHAHAQQGSVQVERLVERFEQDLERAFASGRSALDRFRSRHQMQAAASLNGLLTAESSDKDRLYVAWHLLAMNPAHAGARAVFEAHDLPLPLDERQAFAPQEAAPAPDNRDLVRRVQRALYPSNQEVIATVQPLVSAYSRANTNPTRNFIRSLARLRSDPALQRLVDPVLSFYFPGEARRAGLRPNPEGRNWLNPIDRYLLQHGLLSCELGETAPERGRVVRQGGDPETIRCEQDALWRFPIRLAHWSMELLLEQGSSGQSSVGSGSAAEITLAWQENGQIRVSGNGIDVSERLEAGTHYVQLVASGRHWVFAVNGAQLASGKMTGQAWRQLQVQRGTSAYALRLRYLSGSSAYLSTMAPGARPSPAAAEEVAEAAAWRQGLEQSLTQSIEFSFQDVALKEVVAGLNQISSLAWHLDDSAMPLQDLPLHLSGEGMSGQQLLAWFERLAGLSYRLEERGVVLYWD